MLRLPTNNMALTLIWMIVIGMNVAGVNSQGCEAIISGPLNREGFAPFLSILEINDIHPAVVRCHLTCLNQQGAWAYNPAMALIITSQEQFVSVHGPYVSSRDGLYVIYGNSSYCEAQNNYTMEFEYLIYSNSSTIDRSVVVCGVTFHNWPTPPYTCWGQSYGIIHYDSESTPMVTNTLSTTHSEPAPTTTLTTTRICDTIISTVFAYDNIKTASDPIPIVNGNISIRYGSELIHTLIWIIVIISILLIITLPLSGAFLYTRSRRRLIAPQIEYVHTVEQTLAIKLEQPSVKTMKEEGTLTSFSEDCNCSPVQVQLDQKLPDTISSRNTKI